MHIRNNIIYLIRKNLVLSVVISSSRSFNSFSQSKFILSLQFFAQLRSFIYPFFSLVLVLVLFLSLSLAFCVFLYALTILYGLLIHKPYKYLKRCIRFFRLFKSHCENCNSIVHFRLLLCKICTRDPFKFYLEYCTLHMIRCSFSVEIGMARYSQRERERNNKRHSNSNSSVCNNNKHSYYTIDDDDYHENSFILCRDIYEILCPFFQLNFKQKLQFVLTGPFPMSLRRLPLFSPYTNTTTTLASPPSTYFHLTSA